MPIRYLIVGITALAALWMYIDRVCISILASSIQTDLHLTKEEKADVLGAFFLTYALFQIPIGALADRYGTRRILTLSIVGWSLVTALTGFANGYWTLLAIRLLLGITEAGAYPAAAGLVKNWAEPQERGRFSSAVAAGGRIGMTIAPYLTSWLALALAGFTILGLQTGESGKNWRGVFVLYGICGLLVAFLFWSIVRDRPRDATHQPVERDLVSGQQLSFFQRMRVIVSCRRMWLFGFVQFGTNFSWVFLITLLPTYLNDADVDFKWQGPIQSGILFVGCLGMLFGGHASDVMSRRFGLRWGRALPIAITMFGCAFLCGLMSSSPPLWVAIAILALMAFLNDLGVPSSWAFAQDVGGKNVGAALGWGNMLGNLGAALSPRLLTELQTLGGWSAAFALCTVSFVGAAVAGMLLDASKPLEE